MYALEGFFSVKDKWIFEVLLMYPNTLKLVFLKIIKRKRDDIRVKKIKRLQGLLLTVLLYYISIDSQAL